MGISSIWKENFSPEHIEWAFAGGLLDGNTWNVLGYCPKLLNWELGTERWCFTPAEPNATFLWVLNFAIRDVLEFSI